MVLIGEYVCSDPVVSEEVGYKPWLGNIESAQSLRGKMLYGKALSLKLMF